MIHYIQWSIQGVANTAGPMAHPTIYVEGHGAFALVMKGDYRPVPKRNAQRMSELFEIVKKCDPLTDAVVLTHTNARQLLTERVSDFMESISEPAEDDDD